MRPRSRIAEAARSGGRRGSRRHAARRAPPIAAFLAVIALALLLGCRGGEPDPPVGGIPGGAAVREQTDSGPSTSAEPANTPPSTTAVAASEPASSEHATAAEPASPVTVVPTAVARAPRTQPAVRRARLVFTGDVLSHGPVTTRARALGSADLRYDYRPMFAQVREHITVADLAICHLESPLSASNENLSGFPLFNAPGDLAAALADAGYDGCSAASNHSLDQGIAGIASTLEVLERRGLGHAGMARTPSEAAAPTVYVVNGIAVGHLSYTYGLNGLRLPPDRLWAVDVTARSEIEAEARAAREAGAEFVVLSIQWGWEYTSVPSASQRELATELLASPDIDLIVGSHAHVVQPIDSVNGKYVIYGLGNFLTNQSPWSCRSCPAATVDGVIVGVELTETPAGRIEVVSLDAIPTWVEHPTFTIVDVAGELDLQLGPNRRAALRRSWQRTAGVLRGEGVHMTIKGDPNRAGTSSGAPDVPSRWPLAPR